MIDELLTNIDSNKYNIIFNKPKNYAISYYTIDIFNADINHPLHKFWFFIPRAKVIDKTNKSITLALSNNEDDTKLVKYIEELENRILKSTKENLFNSIKKIIKSFAMKENYPPTIILDIREDIPIFNYNDEETNINGIENNSLISMFIELDNVMASFDQVWILWKILQIKKLDNIDLKKSFFITPRKQNVIPDTPLYVSVQQSYIQPPQSPRQPFIPIAPPLSLLNNISPKIEKNQDNNIKTQNTGRFVISQTDIQNQLTRLKKVNVEKNLQENGNDINIYKKELKKVETKGPLETIIWYNDSLETEILTEIIYGHLDNIFLNNLIRLKKVMKHKINRINDNYNKIIQLFYR